MTSLSYTSMYDERTMAFPTPLPSTAPVHYSLQFTRITNDYLSGMTLKPSFHNIILQSNYCGSKIQNCPQIMQQYEYVYHQSLMTIGSVKCKANHET